jgi:hypothetical protein
MPSALGAAGVYDHDGRHRAGRDPDGCEVDSAPHSVSGNTKFRRPEYYHGRIVTAAKSSSATLAIGLAIGHGRA